MQTPADYRERSPTSFSKETGQGVPQDDIRSVSDPKNAKIGEGVTTNSAVDPSESKHQRNNNNGQDGIGLVVGVGQGVNREIANHTHNTTNSAIFMNGSATQLGAPWDISILNQDKHIQSILN